MRDVSRTDRPGLHVAIIMDGNGRWAQARSRRREWGHREGARAVRRVVEASPDLGINVLTLYAFSSDNWQRPKREVSLLMKLFRRYLKSEVDELKAEGVRLQVIGRRDRLEPDLVRLIEEAEATTASERRLTLRLAVDYSSRDLLVSAVREAAAGTDLDRASLSVLLGKVMHSEGPAPDVDLLIRTGGEKRLSDFLLWECAYAELVFTDRMWPDFHGEALATAVSDFAGRDRRFGCVAEAS
ncbi:MAG: polyprenyl diphosphate synthase [Gemmatimonadota bacterium]|nr:polyprenyl diphosphate synthase [Gemmatimonadota bacterium]